MKDCAYLVTYATHKATLTNPLAQEKFKTMEKFRYVVLDEPKIFLKF